VFAPSREDIEETHGRWIEREPEIWERADWDERERVLTLGVRGPSGETEMAIAWLPTDRWRELLAEAGFVDVELFGWFDRRRYRGGEDSVWIGRAPG
jgi:hypothetical protein